ncbi:hypothetical protein PSENEW3_00002679 [Picochlorum sp. SENEW3]|nr:hypothetical protein PSENEW3_00002679 [Picochlorum sp. SENEW3]
MSKNISILSHEPNTASIMMATRQLSESSIPSGFPGRCDLVYGTRSSVTMNPSDFVWMNVHSSEHPRTVFVRTEHLGDFHQKIMPCLAEPIVLLSGDSDKTVPRQLDPRFNFKCINETAWEQLHQAENEMIIHHFAENLDTAGPKVTPLPLGMNPHEYSPEHILDIVAQHKALSPYHNHDAETIVSHKRGMLRVVDTSRPHSDDRILVRRLCESWEFCDPKSELPRGDAYLFTLMDYSFLLCPHGGGLDPSPKAWEAIALGVIPIIKKYNDDSAYRQLPVVLVDEWSEDSITEEKLAEWKRRLHPYYSTPEGRLEVLYRLSMEYWWKHVENKLKGNEYDEEEMFVE